MKFLLPVLIFASTLAQAQKRDLRYVIGAITDSTARVVCFGDTIRGVYYWNALTISDHEGDKWIETAGLINKDSATGAWVYELYDLKPEVKYGLFVFYRDTTIRDTITPKLGNPQGKFAWWKEPYQYKGKTYNSKYFEKLLRQPARLNYVRIKHDEDED